MSTTKRCPQCGIELPTDAPRGLCPRCLLNEGMASAEQGSGSETATAARFGSFEPPDPAALARDFPQLEVVDLLGQGGMGAVYRARQKGLDRLVALKVLPPEVARDPAFAERFAREARALARLCHPHIVVVHDSGKAGDLKSTLMGNPETGYSALAAELGMTEGALKVAAHRLRHRYRQLLLEEIGRTVDDPCRIDEEIRDLFDALGL